MFDFLRKNDLRPVGQVPEGPLPQKPVELKGETSSREGCFAVVYIGNGASGQSYDERFREAGIDGTVLTGIGGTANLCAIQYCPASGPFPPIISAFTHEEGLFGGFTVRRKREGRWEWYCEDGRWHPAEPDMPAKVRCREGEVPAFAPEGGPVFVCEAKWTGEGGEVLDCGYRMFRNPLMAHSFGAMKGKIYHNTIPAYKNGIRNGYKYFEIDLSMTVDERLVLCHGWKESNCVHTGFQWTPELEQNMTYDRLMKMKVHGNSQIDARSFYKYIKKNPDHFFEIDFHKYYNENIQKRVRLMLEDFRYDPEVIDRCLVQAVNKRMFAAMDSEWHFQYWQYLVGKAVLELDELITFMLDEGICAAAMRVSLTKKECIQKLRNAGIYILVYTMKKDVAAAKTLLDNGVNTICTDYITMDQLRGQEKGMGKHPFYIYYHSGEKCGEHDYTGPEYDEKDLVRTKAGNLEYHDPSVWVNDGQRQLRECRFRIPGRRFKGWQLRMKVDDIWFWYCDDGCYRTRGEFGFTDKTYPHLFGETETLPRMTVKDNARLVMVAAWEPIPGEEAENGGPHASE